jgi:Xaa-Pro aminopeptidase
MELKAGRTVSELAFANTLEQFYAVEKDFRGLSFNTICGIAANSSIVHYGTPSPRKKAKAGDWFLVDSGTQYTGGTTDATRTTVIGKPNRLQKQRYTAVLKAHIDCAGQIFPEGTTGQQLDAIARAAVWKAGLDYGHGTGHGVGAFLNVHEGPQSISTRGTVALEPGMVVSIEPGYYEPGWGGIRLENLYLVIKAKPSNPKDKRNWYGFESLTVLPFDPRLVDFDALSPEQLAWLRRYNRFVLNKLGRLLSPGELGQLRKECRPS